jgi:homoserine kinase type II
MELASVLAAYNLTPPVAVLPMAQGSNNTTRLVQTGVGDLVWREYRSHSAATTIQYEHRLLTWLAGSSLSFAVPTPVPTRDGSTIVADSDSWHALFTRLPGGHPDINNQGQVEAIGAALGELHIALRDYPTTPRPGMFNSGSLTRLHPLMPDPFSVTPTSLDLPETTEYVELLAWFRHELAQLQAWIDGPYQTLPRQVIHGDYGPANTLFIGDQLTGVLDFDYAGPDVRAMDLAAGWKFTVRTWETADPWPATATFFRGYRHWGDITQEEAEALPWLVRLRDAISTTLRLGRGLARGDVRPYLPRITGMQEQVKWLEQRGVRLIEQVRWPA